ncbi:MAG: undecaprenyl/decaprenyl-phosphate alpha-N-acetylglucosaminyl 1-phosphate transferase [Chloroflexota bacterium]|nr:MAG: undecaprenyl/decaprenyl-phosphate alpha-N-acetylglucosaminyl 1-phosphate transferase [Chloroflexota bacterium]
MIELSLALVLLVSLGLALVLTPLAGRVGVRLGIVDKPRRGELQSRVIPRCGGYALFIAFVVGVLLSIPTIQRFPDEYPRLMGLLLGALVILPLAIIDDFKRLGPRPQLIGQIVVASVPLAFGVAFDGLVNPFGGVIAIPSLLAGPLTILWIVGMTNTFNFIDTMDGLAAGIGLIGSVVLFAISFQFGQFSISALPLALAGATAGFLVFNFHPARIFMGTSGSMLIGYALAVLAIIGGAKIATTAMVLGIPIVDVAFVIVYRLSRRRSPFTGGDSAHLPHRLLALGLSQREVALLLYALCLVFGLLALLLTRAQKLYGFAALALVIVALITFAATHKGIAPQRDNRLPSPENGPENS